MLVLVAGLIVTVLTMVPVLLQLRQHPRGLFILFFAEMWERFSYYGMRGLLIFYLTQHFLFDDAYAQGQYGAYTSLVYLLPLIGGFVADRWLGELGYDKVYGASNPFDFMEMMRFAKGRAPLSSFASWADAQNAVSTNTKVKYLFIPEIF